MLDSVFCTQHPVLFLHGNRGELGELNKSRLLDFCSSSIQKKEISLGMIKRFSLLEELYGDKKKLGG